MEEKREGRDGHAGTEILKIIGQQAEHGTRGRWSVAGEGWINYTTSIRTITTLCSGAKDSPKIG